MGSSRVCSVPAGLFALVSFLALLGSLGMVSFKYTLRHTSERPPLPPPPPPPPQLKEHRREDSDFAGTEPARIVAELIATKTKLAQEEAQRLVAEQTVAAFEKLEVQRKRAADGCAKLDGGGVGGDGGAKGDAWRQTLKIYVYELPPDFNTNLLDPEVPRFYDCRESMYGAEILIHEQLLQSPFRTMDPEAANLFYLPIYTSCFRSVRVHYASRSLKERDGTLLRGRGSTVEEDLFHFVFSAIDYVAQEYPYWHRQQGRDHVLTFTHDFGACFTYHEEDTFKVERIQIQRALHNAILLQYFGDLKSSCFQSRKDVVIPPFVFDKGVLAKRGGAANKPTAAKLTSVYFRGKIEFHGEATRPGYSRGVRKRINATYFTYPPNQNIAIREGHSKYYLQELQNSKLCLAPPGYALWTPRLTESVIVGCVPLIIGDDIELPFEWLVDYRSFAVRVSEGNAHKIEEIVDKIGNDALERKRIALQVHWRRFVYNEPAEPGDAFDTIMQRLANRASEQRPVGNDEF
jgi:hypothetical protein